MEQFLHVDCFLSQGSLSKSNLVTKTQRDLAITHRTRLQITSYFNPVKFLVTTDGAYWLCPKYYNTVFSKCCLSPKNHRAKTQGHFVSGKRSRTTPGSDMKPSQLSVAGARAEAGECFASVPERFTSSGVLLPLPRLCLIVCFLEEFRISLPINCSPR